MDTKTQNIVITILGLLLVACLWFTFNLFGKSDATDTSEFATPIEESARNLDLDFDDVDVNLDQLREKFGVYAAEFPEDAEVSSQSQTRNESYAPQRTNYESGNIPAYMVIAGAFSTNENAETFKRMLIDKGFDGSETVKFQSSKYTSICVNRTNDLAQAKAAVETLKGLNIEAYVHTRKISSN